jgi:hypothetical protein
VVSVEFDAKLNPKPVEDQLIAASEIVEVMGVKALGRKYQGML